jgi:hypothetical protein
VRGRHKFFIRLIHMLNIFFFIFYIINKSKTDEFQKKKLIDQINFRTLKKQTQF